MLVNAFLLVGTFLFIVPQAAQAYLDPGTGSFLAQTVIAAVLGTVISFRKKLLSFFQGKPKQPSTESAAKETTE